MIPGAKSIIIQIRIYFYFFFKQKTAYEISTRDWSSDVCSSDQYTPRLFIAQKSMMSPTRKRCCESYSRRKASSRSAWQARVPRWMSERKIERTSRAIWRASLDTACDGVVTACRMPGSPKSGSEDQNRGQTPKS